MARLRYNGLTAELGAALTSGDTTITFAAALSHSGGTLLPTISGTDYIPFSILDTSGNLTEIVSLTAYASGATTGTITRAQESTTAVPHSVGDPVVHAPTSVDFSAGGETAWTTPTMTNGWLNFGAPYANVGYRKDGEGRVTLRGLIKSGTLGSAAFTLPAGYRPTADLILAVISNDAFGEVIITSAGDVKPTNPASNSWVSLTGLEFYTN